MKLDNLNVDNLKKCKSCKGKKYDILGPTHSVSNQKLYGPVRKPCQACGGTGFKLIVTWDSIPASLQSEIFTLMNLEKIEK